MSNDKMDVFYKWIIIVVIIAGVVFFIYNKGIQTGAKQVSANGKVKVEKQDSDLTSSSDEDRTNERRRAAIYLRAASSLGIWVSGRDDPKICRDAREILKQSSELLGYNVPAGMDEAQDEKDCIKYTSKVIEAMLNSTETDLELEAATIGAMVSGIVMTDGPLADMLPSDRVSKEHKQIYQEGLDTIIESSKTIGLSDSLINEAESLKSKSLSASTASDLYGFSIEVLEWSRSAASEISED